MLFISAVVVALVGLILTDLFGFAVGGWLFVIAVALLVTATVRRFRQNRAPLRASSRSAGAAGAAGAGGWYVGSGGGGSESSGGDSGGGGCGGGGGGCGGGG
ncbi:hypothetical protein [Nocardia jinanensis]|uniref:Uncharacterized protein n=1 Tax=Nocardia jinanensis TaxID=382504 RepID=A0A917VNY3_9NOCA|nr:hypothetical protein [Nocardia jinanensis]GGL00021.1 hypothetical protein GCM10011588_13310 [Nocardia jinanensis]